MPSAKNYRLPEDATVHESGVADGCDGTWTAVLTVSVPGQGGYDRPPTDDIFKTFEGPTAEQDARAWLARKLKHEV